MFVLLGRGRGLEWESERSVLIATVEGGMGTKGKKEGSVSVSFPAAVVWFFSLSLSPPSSSVQSSPERGKEGKTAAAAAVLKRAVEEEED